MKIAEINIDITDCDLIRQKNQYIIDIDDVFYKKFNFS